MEAAHYQPSFSVSQIAAQMLVEPHYHNANVIQVQMWGLLFLQTHTKATEKLHQGLLCCSWVPKFSWPRILRDFESFALP